MRHALITGAGGFVGRALLARLRDSQWRIDALRHDTSRLDGVDAQWRLDAPNGTAINEAVRSKDVVFHLAARVHQMQDSARDPLGEYRVSNVDFTLRVAAAAAAAGVRRFVFVSTAKVHGERGAFTEADVAAPRDPYAQSKLEAEQALFALGSKTGMEIVCIRPPLVYGPGVRANFQSLMRLVRSGIPLPFKSVRNQRSLIAVGNLADLLAVAALHPNAVQQVFLARDGEDLSTPDLIQRLAAAMGRRARLISVDPAVLRGLAGAFGRAGAIDRLTESFTVNASKAETLLGWRPPMSVNAALRSAVEGLGK